MENGAKDNAAMEKSQKGLPKRLCGRGGGKWAYGVGRPTAQPSSTPPRHRTLRSRAITREEDNVVVQ